MKKIIWVFGESATGKLTLINSLYNNEETTVNTFHMNDKKISVSDITLDDGSINQNIIGDNNDYDDSLMEEENLYFDTKSGTERDDVLNDLFNKIINQKRSNVK